MTLEQLTIGYEFWARFYLIIGVVMGVYVYQIGLKRRYRLDTRLIAFFLTCFLWPWFLYDYYFREDD